MTNEEAIKVNEARLQCIRNRVSGTVAPCNVGACDGCLLNYKQGNMGEQKEALDMAIKALRGQQTTDEDIKKYLADRPCDVCVFHKEEGCSKWSCVFEE